MNEATANLGYHDATNNQAQGYFIPAVIDELAYTQTGQQNGPLASSMSDAGMGVSEPVLRVQAGPSRALIRRQKGLHRPEKRMPQNPINPYGQRKLMVEQILKDCTKGGFLCAVSLQYCNAADADAEAEIGEAHDRETHLIPLTLSAAWGTAPPLMIFGNDYATLDGTSIRDYIHVTDLVDAHLEAFTHTSSNKGFSVFNLDTGTCISIKELIKAAKEVTGREIPFSYGPRRAEDPAALVADPSLARDVLGWSVRESDLHKILQTALDWMQSQ